jgi:hypothetical protein
MRVKPLLQPLGLIGAVCSAAGPGWASPSPVTPTTRPPVIAPPVTPPAPAQPAPGASSTGTIYSAVTVDQVADVLRNKGYKAEVRATPNAGQVIASGTLGVNYLIFFYACSTDTVTSCKAIQFVAIWKNDSGLTVNDANTCNDHTLFGKLIAFPDRIVLAHAAGAEGSSDPFFEAQINIWEAAIMSARQCFAQNNHATPPAKGAPAPHAENGAAAPHAENAVPSPFLAGQVSTSVAISDIPPSDFNLMPEADTPKPQ